VTIERTLTTDQIITAMHDSGDDAADWAEYIDVDTGASIAPARKFWQLLWDDHCRGLLIGDATIHGPYDTPEDAAARNSR